MAFPTTNATQELPAINQILMACGQAPVTTLDETNPDVAITYTTLLEVSREVQSEGWSFNKESHVSMDPDTNNEILYTNNMLQMDLSASNAYDKQTVRKNGKLYDKEHHTDQWTDGAVDVDITWLFDWVDLPTPIQDYITARAATIVSSRIIGDKTQYQMLQQKEAYTRAMALEYECNQGDYSFFGKPDGSGVYASYEPYKALMR